MGTSMTPMMQQYHAARNNLPPETLLLFRLGDFYELFFEDARIASTILNIALTKRGKILMCGVPYHTVKPYVSRLIAAGKRVALCDQVGEVQQGKLVHREVTKVLSAGTLDEIGLEATKNNYIAALLSLKGEYGFAYIDLSTGEFKLTQLTSLTKLRCELARVAPAEILASAAQKELFSKIANVSQTEEDRFKIEFTESLLQEHFQVVSLDGFGCSQIKAAVGAAGALLHFIVNDLRRDATHLQRPHPYQISDYVLLDTTANFHLELVQSKSGRTATLLGAVDCTVTAMGSRMLREWLLHPLRLVEEIRRRQDVVAALLDNSLSLVELRDTLTQVQDMERTISRLSQKISTAQDLVALANSLAQLPDIIAILYRFRQVSNTTKVPCLITSLAESICPLPELCNLLSSAIVDDPHTLYDGCSVIREGYHATLDQLRAVSKEGKLWIASLQEREAVRTGIKSLKVRYNSVFGYFIEVTNAHLSSVPQAYVRKQTIVGGERFVTPELKEVEERILEADEKAKSLEMQIVQSLREQVLTHLADIQQSACALATIDALASFAEIARLYNYQRPLIDESGVLYIEEGRHPVLDRQMREGIFVPNDTALDCTGTKIAIVTGPNMAGKSTYIRQVALLVLLSQTGSFLPVKSAHIGVIDQIFTRVGASDNLAKGQSTFMVEMSETANILNNATAKSLVILDEIGRGTSTFDGLSIAWSVAEYLHDHIGVRTLFATHYHELTDLERTCSGVRNFNVSAQEANGQVVFLRKIVPGRAEQSYGIQVARLAGLPNSVLLRAKEVLFNLEKLELNVGRPHPIFNSLRRRVKMIPEQLDLFFRPE